MIDPSIRGGQLSTNGPLLSSAESFHQITKWAVACKTDVSHTAETEAFLTKGYFTKIQLKLRACWDAKPFHWIKCILAFLTKGYFTKIQLKIRACWDAKPCHWIKRLLALLTKGYFTKIQFNIRVCWDAKLCHWINRLPTFRNARFQGIESDTQDHHP